MKPVLLLTMVLLWNGVQARDTIPVFNKEIRSTDIVLGIHWQGNARENITYRYYEIGVGKGRYIHHRHGVTGGAIYMSEEIYLGRDRTIFGTKLGVFWHWLFDAGLSMVYYTDLERGNFKVRPELGVGMGRARAVLGFNIPTIANKRFEDLRRNIFQISLQATIGVFKKTKRL